MFPYLNGTGVTQFPFERTVPGPHDGNLCRHTGGLPLGTNYTLSSQVGQTRAHFEADTVVTTVLLAPACCVLPAWMMSRSQTYKPATVVLSGSSVPNLGDRPSNVFRGSRSLSGTSDRPGVQSKASYRKPAADFLKFNSCRRRSLL